jgi:hypothetical protein
MAGPSEWQLNVTSRWTNLTASFVRFGSPTTAGRPNAGYGGLFLRGSEALLGAQVVLDGEPLSADVAQGRTGSTMALAATDPPLTVALHANAANPVSPTPWFVRTEPVVMLCAAPFFHTKWTLAASESVVWSWRLTVSDTGGR